MDKLTPSIRIIVMIYRSIDHIYFVMIYDPHDQGTTI